MEQNAPLFAKKVWKLVRVLYFMLRKGISKSKLLHDLNKMMKLGKIAGKSLHNLMFHNQHHDHHNNWATSFAAYNLSPPPGEYEFSCSNSPSTNTHHTFSLNPFHKKHHSTSSNNKQHNGGDLDMRAVNAAVLKAMEMIQSETSSPALPGFGRSPMVRQLRVTDSPFPINSVDEDSHVVDEAAEKFINRFYNDLRRQNANATSFGPYI